MRRTLVLTALALAFSAQAQPKSEAKAPPERTIAQVDASSATQRQQQSLIKKGHRLYRSGNFKEALKLAEEALQSNPSDKNALSLKYSLVGRIKPREENRQTPPSDAAAQASPLYTPSKPKAEAVIPPDPIDTPVPAKKDIPVWPIPLAAGTAAAAVAYTIKRSRETLTCEDATNKNTAPPSKLGTIVGYALVGVALLVLVIASRGLILRAATALEAAAYRLAPQAARIAQSEAGAVGGASATAQAERQIIAEEAAPAVADTIVARWGPMSDSSGPLNSKIVETFRSGTYNEKILNSSRVYYRVFGGKSTEKGIYWTATPPTGPLQSTIDSALFRSLGNTAKEVVKIKVPAGETVYEGFAAAQEGIMGGGTQGLVGGGNQTVILKVKPEWYLK